MTTNIVVVGSLMMDLVVRVPRLPLVGESLAGSSLQMFVGGKGGNQATAAARAGADHIAMVGRVGADAFGKQVLAALHRDGVGTQGVSVDPDVATGVAIPLVFDDGGNSIVTAPGANLCVSTADIERARAAIEAASILVLQFEVAMEAVVTAVSAARAAGVPVLLNAAPFAPPPDDLLSMVDYLVVNEVESAALTPGVAPRPLLQAAALLAGGAKNVLVTLGAQGVLVVGPGGAVEQRAFPVKAIDSVGAGDAFCGALAVRLAEGAALPEATRFAAAAGAISVTRAGAAASLPARAEIAELLAGNADRS